MAPTGAVVIGLSQYCRTVGEGVDKGIKLARNNLPKHAFKNLPLMQALPRIADSRTSLPDTFSRASMAGVATRGTQVRKSDSSLPEETRLEASRNGNLPIKSLWGRGLYVGRQRWTSAHPRTTPKSRG